MNSTGLDRIPRPADSFWRIDQSGGMNAEARNAPSGSIFMNAETADRTSLALQLLERIETRKATVAVMGLGHVGLPLAETFAWAGFPVLGFDIDAAKTERLKESRSYIGHPCSDQMAELGGDVRFDATSDPSRLRDADAIVICVPTTITDAREPDLSCITSTGATLCPHLRAGQLVVLESTTYPGTTDNVLRPILEESGLRAGRDFFLAYSPQREDPGNRDFATRNIPKVVGGINLPSRELAEALYEPVADGVVPVSGTGVAEACKVLENTYRAVNIALVNELKIVFQRMGIDIWEVIEAASTKPFGFQAFYPGPGLGGHHIPIDPFYLAWAARQHGVNPRFIEFAGEVNTSMPDYVLTRITEALNDRGKSVQHSRVCILGVAYKRDVDDPRESPAISLLELLESRGAVVTYNDPHLPVLPQMHCRSTGVASQPLSEAFLAAQDCTVIITDHSDYDFEWIVRHCSLIVDTRNATAGCRAPPGRIWKA
jgi:UDP-N-acetyl-D-glucosamine dehydrogenase